MNSRFIAINPNQINDNVFKLIGSDWMLVTAADKDGGFNSMTASWGGLGVLWNKPVCFCFIRPQRYTFGFAERGDSITLSFFGEEYRDALVVFGTKSGRDTDKVKETGLTPVKYENGVYYGEARLVLTAKTLYADYLKKDCFLDLTPLSNYKTDDFHRMYICEITQCFEKKQHGI